ncbi:hypothetical protein [Neomegalonema perideroedes]|uniref:hypothetical protein n=1 Tax=Neomegalonema perideroedes TaxID=217219 RepID=UPI000380A426|nr:hypothetical protein [Neomegalonema perideroedes]
MIRKVKVWLVAHKDELTAGYVMLFLSFWIFGFATALANGTCQKETRDMEKKLSSCRFSAPGVSFVVLTGGPKGKYVRFHTEYAVALLRTGREKEARGQFCKALEAAATASPRRPQDAEAEADSRILKILARHAEQELLLRNLSETQILFRRDGGCPA